MSLTAPKLSSNLKKRLLNGLVLGISIGVFGLGVHSVMQLEVGPVSVSGNDRVSTVAVRHLGDIREGQKLLSLDLEQAERHIERHPWVRDAIIERDFSGAVTIEVHEHHPSLLLAYTGLYHVSSTGEIFAKARGEHLDLPLLTGLERELVEHNPEVAQEIINRAVSLKNGLVAADVIDDSRVSEIHFDRDLGFTVLLRDRTRIRFGLRSSEEQITRLQAMLRSGLELNTPQEIDLDLDGMALATPLSS